MHHLNNPAYQVFDWTDSVNTGAKGWVVIDSLVNGLAAGGLFIHSEATLEEVCDLARTMSFKNTLLDPIIGGAKAGIRFNHQDPRTPGVIRRFLLAHKSLLENLWYTGADLNTRNDFIFEVIEQDLKLPSVFYSLGKMLNTHLNIPDQSAFLRNRLSSPVGNNFTLETSATGYSIATAIKIFFPKTKPRILIQGFGAVGSSLNYFLNLQRIATVVGIADLHGYIINPSGISILTLPDIKKSKYQWVPRVESETDEAFLCRFLSEQPAEIFSSCATRYQLTEKVANTLISNTFQQVSSDARFIISGANNIFRSETIRKILENSGVHVLPEWVSNSGNTILFMESMKQAPLNQNWNQYLFKTISTRIKAFIHPEMISNHKNKLKLYEYCSDLAMDKLRHALRKNMTHLDKTIVALGD